MLKIALTGNIGSGKTTVSRVFSVLGVPAYNADENARRFLMSPYVNARLSETFGESVMDEKGLPDRAKLASLVFNDEQMLKKLNCIIHPLVMNDFEAWTNEYANMPYVILESAIIFENGLDKLFDQIILVTAPEEQRIKRVEKRDHFTRDQVMERVKNQILEEIKAEMSDFVINNSDDVMVIPQVLEIHSSLTKLGC